MQILFITPNNALVVRSTLCKLLCVVCPIKVQPGIMIPSKNIQKIKLVTFDAFGTILHLSKPVPIVYSEVAQKYGVHATIDEIEHNSNKAFKDFSEKHKNHGKKSGLNPHDWWIKVCV